MKLIITRIGTGKEKQNQNKPCIRMKTKMLTVMTGIVLTLAVCLAAEQIPEGSVSTSAQISEGDFSLPVICYEKPDASVLSADLDYLAGAGAETVTCSELISMFRGLKEIPEKPVLLLFSGSGREIFTDYAPVLQKKNVKANVVICGSDADLYSNSIPKTDEAKLSWNEIRSLEKSGLIETVSGGYALCHTEKTFSPEELKEDLLLMQTRMNEELFHDASVLVCPCEKGSEQLAVELGFLMVLKEREDTDHSKDAGNLYFVDYISRGDSSPEEFFAFGQ